MGTSIHRATLLLGLLTLSVAAAWAQKVDIDVQSTKSMRYGYWFLASYVVSVDGGSDAPVSFDLQSNDSFDAVCIDEAKVKDGFVFRVKDKSETTLNFAFRAKKVGDQTLPKLELKIGDKNFSSKSHKVQIEMAKEPWQFDNDKLKAFVITEVSKPVTHMSDTLKVTYKLYVNNVKNSDVHNLMIVEFNPPKLSDFYATYEAPVWDEDHTKPNFLGGIWKGEVFRVIDLGSYILQPRKSGAIVLGKGNIRIDYVLDKTSTFKKILAPVRAIKNDRQQRSIPINEVVIEVVK